MKVVIRLLFVFMFAINLNACGGLLGPSKQELQAKADLANRQQQELTRLNCIDLQNFKTKKYKDGKTFIEKLKVLSKDSSITDVKYSVRLSYFLSNLKFNKNDFMYIEANKAKVFQNIPNLGVLVRFSLQYGNDLFFLIKGYQDVDGATIDKSLMLINDGTYSYKAHFGIKTVYSFKVVTDKDNAFVEDLKNITKGNYVNEEECQYINKEPITDTEKVKLLELSTVYQYKRLQYFASLNNIQPKDLEKIMLEINLNAYQLQTKGANYSTATKILSQMFGGDGKGLTGDNKLSHVLSSLQISTENNQFQMAIDGVDSLFPQEAKKLNVREFLLYKGLQNWDKASNATIAEATK